jgi:Flp pilus assembly protein TadG
MILPLARRGRRIGSARARGQGLVEFALVLPVFMFAVFGVVDGGRYVYQNTVLSQAAREGARLAAVEASWIGSVDPSCGATGGPVCPANSNALKAHALVAANRMVAPFASITSANFYISCDAAGSAPTGSWTGATCTNHSTNNIVSVRVVLTFVPITPVAGQFVVLTMSGSATMVIN